MNATGEAEHPTTLFFFSRQECLHIKSLHVTVKRHRCSLEGGRHSVVLPSTQLERVLKPTLPTKRLFSTACVIQRKKRVLLFSSLACVVYFAL